jgi:hypothetical protein
MAPLHKMAGMVDFAIIVFFLKFTGGMNSAVRSDTVQGVTMAFGFLSELAPATCSTFGVLNKNASSLLKSAGLLAAAIPLLCPWLRRRCSAKVLQESESLSDCGVLRLRVELRRLSVVPRMVDFAIIFFFLKFTGGVNSAVRSDTVQGVTMAFGFLSELAPATCSTFGVLNKNASSLLKSAGLLAAAIPLLCPWLRRRCSTKVLQESESLSDCGVLRLRVELRRLSVVPTLGAACALLGIAAALLAVMSAHLGAIPGIFGGVVKATFN